MRMKLVDTNAHGSLAVAIIIDITEQLKNETGKRTTESGITPGSENGGYRYAGWWDSA